MKETSSIIFLDSSILCNSVRCDLTSVGITNIDLQPPNYSKVYFKSGLVEKLSAHSKVIIIKRTSVAAPIWDLVKKVLLTTVEDAKNTFHVWEDVTFSQLTEWIDDTVVNEFYASEKKLRYLYIDSTDYVGMRELIRDHRLMGALNAGMIIPPNRFILEKDFNFMNEFWCMRESEMTWLKTNANTNKVLA